MQTRSRTSKNKSITLTTALKKINLNSKNRRTLTKPRTGLGNQNSLSAVRRNKPDSVKESDTKNSFCAEKSSKMSALMLPTAPFSSNDPESWFRQLEAIFELSKIEDDATKFIHLQARLDPKILQGVSEFFTDLPAVNKYSALKEKIVSKHSISRDTQVLQLLEGLSLGDRRPSELLGEIRRLAASDLSEKVVRTMFLKKLPEGLASILVGSSEELVNLGTLADQIHAFQRSNSTPQIAALTPVSTSVAVESELSQIKALLSSLVESNVKLATRLASLETERQIRSSRRDRPDSPAPRRRSTSRGRIPEDSKLCYYHYRFMGQAKKCATLQDGSPCKWNLLN